MKITHAETMQIISKSNDTITTIQTKRGIIDSQIRDTAICAFLPIAVIIVLAIVDTL